MRLLIASTNRGKLKEMQEVLTGLPLELVLPADIGLRLHVEETGETYAQNAEIKARAYQAASGLLTLADDSGLAVDALSGRPGVLSARYGGPGTTAVGRYQLLLAELRDVPTEQRTARFHCVTALAAPNGELIGTADGVCEGVIAMGPSGEGGFGYDPVFYLPQYGLTMAQLDAAEKNRISHRGRAAVAIAPQLRRALAGS